MFTHKCNRVSGAQMPPNHSGGDNIFLLSGLSLTGNKVLYYPTVQVGSPRSHSFPSRDALGVSLLVAPLGRRKSRSPEGPTGLEIWVAGGWAGSRDPVSPLWDLDRPTWPLLSGYKSVEQAPPGQADLAGGSGQITTDSHAGCFRCHLLHRSWARSSTGRRLDPTGVGEKVQVCTGLKPGFFQARVAKPPCREDKAQRRGDWTVTLYKAPIPAPVPDGTARPLTSPGSVGLTPAALYCAAWTDQGHMGQNSKPSPKVHREFSASLFHGSGGMFVVGTAEPLSQGRPGPCCRAPGQDAMGSAADLSVSPRVAKVVKQTLAALLNLI